MDKIKMTTPLVEMDGDEMTRILWQMIKEELLLPFVDLKTEYYDLGLPEPGRDRRPGDRRRRRCHQANTAWPSSAPPSPPTRQRVEEYQLNEMWKSPNGTIRAILDGTVFRAPIMVKGIEPGACKNWKKPITIARHAYGDVYKSVEIRVPGPGKAELVFTRRGRHGESARPSTSSTAAGVVQGHAQHGHVHRALSPSACFQYALDTKQDLWFATKDTISKKYDHRFKDIFQEIYDAEYTGAVRGGWASPISTPSSTTPWPGSSAAEGGFIWACKNYDGDVMSDMVSTAFGSPGHDDLGAGLARRQLRVRGRPRHRARATTTSI